MRRINPHDNAILDLARRWEPYGSVPTSEIWLTCGMRHTTNRHERATRDACCVGAEGTQGDCQRAVRRTI